MDDLGFQGTIAELVERRARKAAELGVDGVVASPLEAAAVRRIVGSDTIIVTPGVRSTGVAAGDQKRIATPAQAILDGANYLVIGRQITRAADPSAAVDQILMELAEACS
jgi:orotidine-5'-phosphate decarboxylase